MSTRQNPAASPIVNKDNNATSKKHPLSVLEVPRGNSYIPPAPYKIQQANPTKQKQLTIVTLNTHSLQEKVDCFNKLEWIAKGLGQLKADIIGLNEVVYGNIYAHNCRGAYYDTAIIIKKYLEANTGIKYFLYKKEFAKWENGENLANAILCKYPLHNCSSIELTTRDFWPAPHSKRNCLYSQLEFATGKLNIFLTHTMGYDFPDTIDQIIEVKDFVAKKQCKTLGSIVMGDFNVPYKHLFYWQLRKEFPEFVDTYALTNPDSTCGPKDDERLDYIFWVDGIFLLNPKKVTSTIVFKDETYEGYKYPYVSDHFAVVTTIKGLPGLEQ